MSYDGRIMRQALVRFDEDKQRRAAEFARRCLREYYKRAQLSELSQMLDLGSQSFETFSFDWYSDERGERKRSPRENMERNFDRE